MIIVCVQFQCECFVYFIAQLFCFLSLNYTYLFYITILFNDVNLPHCPISPILSTSPFERRKPRSALTATVPPAPPPPLEPNNNSAAYRWAIGVLLLVFYVSWSLNWVKGAQQVIIIIIFFCTTCCLLLYSIKFRASSLNNYFIISESICIHRQSWTSRTRTFAQAGAQPPKCSFPK